MKAYLWSSSDGKSSWTVNERQRHQQGTKPESGKIANCSYSSYSYSRSYSSCQNLCAPITHS